MVTAKEVVGDTLLPPLNGPLAKTRQRTDQWDQVAIPWNQRHQWQWKRQNQEMMKRKNELARRVPKKEGSFRAMKEGMYWVEEEVSISLSPTKERAAHCRETSEKEKGEGEGEAESTMPSKRPENTDTHEE